MLEWFSILQCLIFRLYITKKTILRTSNGSKNNLFDPSCLTSNKYPEVVKKIRNPPQQTIWNIMKGIMEPIKCFIFVKYWTKLNFQPRNNLYSTFFPILFGKNAGVFLVYSLYVSPNFFVISFSSIFAKRE